MDCGPLMSIERETDESGDMSSTGGRACEAGHSQGQEGIL